MNIMEAREVVTSIREGTYVHPYQSVANEYLSIGWSAFGMIFGLPFYAMISAMVLGIVVGIFGSVFPQTWSSTDGRNWSLFPFLGSLFGSPWVWGIIYVVTSSGVGATLAIIQNHLPRSLLILTPWGIIQDIPRRPKQFFFVEFAQLQHMHFYAVTTTVSRGDSWDHETDYYYTLTFKDGSHSTWSPHRTLIDPKVFAAIDEALQRYDPALTNKPSPIPRSNRYGPKPF